MRLLRNRFPDVIVTYNAVLQHKDRAMKCYWDTGSLVKRQTPRSASVVTKEVVDDITHVKKSDKTRREIIGTNRYFLTIRM